MRKRRNKFNNKKTILLSSFLFILVFMSVGFSLLSKNLDIDGTVNLYASKGNLWYKLIHDYSSSNGGSFYESSYENGKYVYMGDGNTNYISFNSELWRIVSVEADHTIKIVRVTDTPSEDLQVEFDSANNRTSESTYCLTPEYGCNAWASQDVLNNGVVANNSSLLSSANYFYNSFLSSTSKNQIVEHEFNIGFATPNSTFSQIITSESDKTWTGYVGMLTLSDFIYPSNISSSTTVPGSFSNNYLLSYGSGRIIWTLTASTEDTSKVWVINYDGTQVTRNAYSTSETVSENTYYYVAYPVVFLKDNLMYSSGDGAKSTPFVIATE